MATAVILRASSFGTLVGGIAGAAYGATCGLIIEAMMSRPDALVLVGWYGFLIGAPVGLALGVTIGVVTLTQRGRSHAGRRVGTIVVALLSTTGAAALTSGLSTLLYSGAEAAFLAVLLVITLPAWIAAVLGWKLIAPFVDRHTSPNDLAPTA